MDHQEKIYKRLRLLSKILIIGFIVFVILVATPVLGHKVGVFLLDFFGCDLGAFDYSPSCPQKNVFTDVLEGMGMWPYAYLSFIFFIFMFWPVLLVWSILIIISKIIEGRYRPKHYRTNTKQLKKRDVSSEVVKHARYTVKGQKQIDDISNE